MLSESLELFMTAENLITYKTRAKMIDKRKKRERILNDSVLPA